MSQTLVDEVVMIETEIKFEDKLQVLRYRNGVKVVNATDGANVLTIARLKAASFSTYFLDRHGNTININDEGAKVCGFKSANDAIGKSLLEVSETDCALHLIHNSISVIQDESIKIFEEENLRRDNTLMQFLSIKAPWYDDTNKVIGTLGCSIVLGQHSLANSLAEIRQLGLLDSSYIPVNNHSVIHEIALSKRELECLRLTVKGYTAKKIARELNISHRTVEEYIFNIRTKVGASSKSELIQMTYQTMNHAL